MKNKFAIFIFAALIFSVLGCGITDRIQRAIEDRPEDNTTVPSSGSNASNKSIADKATEDVLREKTGIPECDEVLDTLADQSKSGDDDFVSKAAKELVFNRIRQSLKESIEKKKNDRASLQKTCREFKTQLEKYNAEQDAKK